MTFQRVDHDARLEDLQWFVDTGENLDGAAQRLGLSVDAIEKWTRKHGRTDLHAALKARNPIDPDRSLSECGRIGATARRAS